MPSFKKQPRAAEESYIALPESSDESDNQFEVSEDDHNIKDPFSENESDWDSDDDAPEAISFKSAHENVLKQKEKAIAVLHIQQDEKRRKRKEFHNQHMLQKMEKRQKIDSKLLPEDVLDELNDHSALETADLKEINVTPDLNEDKDEEVEGKIASKEIIEEHGPTLFKCKNLADEDKQKHIPENALHFKHRLLYEGRIRREKSNQDAETKKRKQLSLTATTRRKPKIVTM